MGRIINGFVAMERLHVTASYIDDGGQEYDIVFTRTIHGKGYDNQLISIEKNGQEIEPKGPIWEKIKEHIACEDDKNWDCVLR